MIETYNNKTYRITYRGISMIENALGNPNLVQISVATGCTIMVAPQPLYGIDYLLNGEYRSWNVTGQNTRINKKESHYLYVRLNREGSDGMFVFSANDYEMDGKIAGNASSVASEDYYYIKTGFITATDSDGMTATVLREIQYDGGYLNTPQASESDPSGWEKLFTVTADNLINVLKRFASFTVQGTLSIIGRLELGLGSGKYIEDLLRSTDEPDESNITDTTVPTALYVEEEMLHRKRPDNAEKVITFDEGLVSEGEAVFNGQVTAKEDVNSPSFTSKRFVEGWIGEGGRLWYDEETGKSKLEVDEVRARDVFETLTFRFNQVDVISGEMWNTFSFGTIKSVDEKRKVVHLDLVEGERMTAHVNDLMRGIFHNVRTENNESDADDECGFPQIQGFSTSYFTPVGLLADGTGFRYALRPGTHVHPQAGMKFAAYGNFTDKSRQSSTYSTRTRLIMLEGVNTWVIDPSRHYTYVRGELNMEYGGMKFVGHGTIQKNSYIYGSQIFFTPKQLEDMKGNSAYSVNLSDYEGIINLDLDGNVVGGVKETFNVVTDGMNVTTDSETLNVVTQGYVLSTRIQAFKGETELFHSDTIEEGAFVVLLTPVGCTASIENGIVEVTGISNPENCYIDMEVNCEGNAVFTKTYKISSVTNGYSPLYIDLDNEMDSVACDSDGTVLFGLPVVTNVSVFYGTKKLDIESLSCTADNGVVVQVSKESGRVSVTYIPKNAPDTLQITITAKALYDGKEYSGTSVFTINKVKTSAIYNLQPSVSSVKVGKDSKNNKVYEVSSVNCSVKKSDGTASSVISSLPDGYSMTYSTDGSSEKTYSYKSYINVESLLKTLKFFLYFGSTLVDVETVPIVIDGDNGESNVMADLDNEMDSVACDSSGNYLFGNPTTTVSMWYGSTQLTLDSLTLDADTGINATSNRSTGVVRVTSVDANAADVSQIRITLKATYNGTQYTRLLTFTINKVKTSAIYNLQPSVSSVKRTAGNAYSVSSVSCSVRKNDGTATTTLSALPTGYTMKYSTDKGSQNSYTYGSSISVTSLSINVQFYLYYGSTLVDVETIPIVIDGAQGSSSFKSTVFIRTNSVPATPTGGSFVSPIPTSSPAWSDGIPSGSAILWASTRIFSYDGKAPEQSAWTTPRQMTDTSDFDVEFSSVENPNPPSGHPNINQQWSNISNDKTIWMATSTCSNGVWSAWTVSKIKGEKGDAGTGIQIKGSKPSVEDLPKTGNTLGDCYTVSGVLYVWDGYSWQSAGNIKGEPGDNGKTPYLHIKYSDDGGVSFTGNNGEDPGKYIGILVDYNVGDSGSPKDYKWSLIRGEDGNGILSETVYYLISNKSTGITTSTAGWSTSYPVMTAANRFLWTYALTRYTNGTSKTDGPKLIGVYGDTGLQGCIMRMFENGITVGQTYRNDASATSGIYRYIDHIAVQNDSYASGYAVYQCKVTHAATSVTEYTNTAYWTPVDQNVGSAFFSYLLAKNANIKLLSGAQFVVQEEKDGKITTVGGMQGDTRYPLIWAGSDEMGRTAAPFRVMASGKMIGTDVNLTGIINAEGGTFNNVSIVSGKIGGFKIVGNSIESRNGAYDGGAGNNYYYSSKFFLHSGGSSSAFIGFSASNKWVGIGLNCMPVTSNMQVLGRFEDTGTSAYTYNKAGLYISIAGATTYDDSNIHGNSALYIPKGHITGFRRRFRRVSTSTTLTNMDSIVRLVNTAEITVTLPSGAEDGQEIWLCSGNEKKVNVKASSGDSITGSGGSFASNRWHIYIYDAYNKKWVYGYTNWE